jgi:hypothetical protein
MTPEDYQEAMSAVKTAAVAYRGGLSDAGVSTAVTTNGTNPWTPIYLELLAELKTALEAAGQHYDAVADAHGIDQTQRFDWRSYLTEP